MKDTDAQEMKSLVDTAPGSLLITDLDGKIVYVNEKMEKTTGFPIAEMIGNRPGNLWGGSMKPSFYRELWSTLQKKGSPFLGRVSNRRKSGRRYEDRLFLAPVFDQKDTLRYYFAVTPDPHISLQTFQREFRATERSPRTADQAAAKLLSWLMPGKAASLAHQAHKPLFDFFTRTLVRPTRQQFSYRDQDKELVLAAQSHPESFNVLYEKYRNDVLAYLSARSQTPQAAEDFTQETFLRAFRYLDSYRPSNASYRTYLFRIAHNLLVNSYRKKQECSLDTLKAEPKTPSARIWDSIDVEFLWQADAGLSETERRALFLKHRDGLSVHEISTILQRSENAVKLLLSRGRKKLTTFYT